MAGRNVLGTAARQVAASHGDLPIFKIILGLVLVFFFLLGLMMDLQTSEAFLLNGGQVTATSLNWGILMQPLDLAQGHIKDWNVAKSIMWGWGCLLVYLVCVVGETTIHNSGWNKIFKTGAFIIVAFDFWTNMNYGTLPSGWGGQMGFAVITSFIVAFFGWLGLKLIFNGINEW